VIDTSTYRTNPKHSLGPQPKLLPGRGTRGPMDRSSWLGLSLGRFLRLSKNSEEGISESEMSFTRRHGRRPSRWRGCWSPADWHDRTLGVRRREVIAGARKARWMAPRDSQAGCPGRWAAVTDTVDPGVAWTRAALCSTRRHSLPTTMDLCVKHSTPPSYWHWQCQISPPGRLYGEGRRPEDRRCGHPRRGII